MRVSKVGDRGDLRGLAAVKPGSTVWLMIYYTVGQLQGNAVRTTTYQVKEGTRTIYEVTYKHVAGERNGRFSRYSVYHVPPGLPYGHYVFRAVLAFGKQQQARSWKFDLANKERMASGQSG